MPTIMIVAGEPSGDLQASRGAAALKELAPDLALSGMGGDLMEEAGVELIYHIRDSAVMGIGEVFTAIPAFLKKREHIKHLIRAKRPDAVVLVDFGDFNMPLARFTHRLGIPVIYYIPPRRGHGDRTVRKRLPRQQPLSRQSFHLRRNFIGRLGQMWSLLGIRCGLCPNRSELRGSSGCDRFERRSSRAWSDARQPTPRS